MKQSRIFFLSSLLIGVVALLAPVSVFAAGEFEPSDPPHPIVATQSIPLTTWVGVCAGADFDGNGEGDERNWQFAANYTYALFKHNQNNLRCNEPTPNYLVFDQDVPEGTYMALCTPDTSAEWLWQVNSSKRVADYLGVQQPKLISDCFIPSPPATQKPPRITGLSAMRLNSVGTSSLDYWIPINDKDIGVIDEQGWRTFARGPVGARIGPSQVDAICTGDEKCWDYLKRISLEKGINFAFAVTLWWEEGGFGLSAGCPSIALDTKKQLDCMTNMIVGADGSFEDFFANFCGPNQTVLCKNNPDHISVVKSVYNSLVPPGNPGAIEPRRDDCRQHCYPPGGGYPSPRGISRVIYDLQAAILSRIALSSAPAPWDFQVGERVLLDVNASDDNGFQDIKNIDFAVNNGASCGFYLRVTEENGNYRASINENSWTNQASSWIVGGLLGPGNPSNSGEVLENSCARFDLGASYIDYINNDMAVHAVATFKHGYAGGSNQVLVARAKDGSGLTSGSGFRILSISVGSSASASAAASNVGLGGACGEGSEPKGATCATGLKCDANTTCKIPLAGDCTDHASDCVTGLSCVNNSCALPAGNVSCRSLSATPLPFDPTKGTVKLSDGTDMKITGGLVPCGRTCDDPTTSAVDESRACTFCSGFVLFNNIVNAVLFVWMPLIIVILVTWGGVLIMVSGQSPSQRLRGKQIIQWALMGYAIMLFAWIIVNTFLSIIGVADWGGIGNWWNPTC